MTAALEVKYPVYLENNHAIPLAPVTLITSPINLTHTTQAHYANQDYQFMAFVRYNGQVLTVTALTMLGIQAYSFDYDGDNLLFESAAIGQGAKGQYLVFDFIMIYADSQKLLDYLKVYGYRLEMSGSEQRWLRKIWYNNVLIMTIQRDADSIRLENHVRTYHYAIKEEEA